MLPDCMSSLLSIQSIEHVFIKRRPDYHFDGKELEWGKDLTEEQMKAMTDNSEVFLLNDIHGKPYAYIFKDAYGNFRQKVINQDN